MILADLRKDIFSILMAYFHEHGWDHIKSKSLFRKVNNDWIWDCAVDSIVRPGHIALETKYFISNKKILLLSRRACKHIALPSAIFGGDVRSVAEVLNKDTGKIGAEQVILATENAEILFKEWSKWFEDIGVPFFSEFSNIKSLNSSFNLQPFNTLPPLVLSGANRILRGPIICVCANSSQEEIKDLLNKYDNLVETVKMRGISDDFRAIRDLTLCLAGK
jgi:hypothetical protein